MYCSSCKPCLPGQYCGAQGLDVPSGPCAKGYYCIRGAWSKKPTDLGVYGYNNATNVSQCFCPNTTTGGICSPGEYCPEGSHAPTPCTRGK